MKIRCVLIVILTVVLVFGACKNNDCQEAAKKKHPLPKDSLLVSYTGSETLKFQITDSNGVVIDTLVFLGKGTNRYWDIYGPKIWCGDAPHNEETEVMIFKYIDKRDSNKFLFLILNAAPEHSENSTIAISYSDYYPGTEDAKGKYKIHTGKLNRGNLNTTLQVLGINYTNVKTVVRTEKPWQYSEYAGQKTYFSNNGGIIKIEENANKIWLKIP